ncbi:MAG: DUF2600 family protein, partial [Solirubrobacteraceae bacterium]
MSRRSPNGASRSTATAALRANVRFWPTVWPVAARELRRWHARACAIPDPRLRALALHKLASERFNCEVAATFATLAPASRRRHATAALVALQVAYDYLDLLTELPMQQGERERALLALGETVSPAGSETTRPQLGLGEDGGYLAALALAVKQSLDSLPSAGAIRATATRRAASCARAQAQRHAS